MRGSIASASASTWVAVSGVILAATTSGSLIPTHGDLRITSLRTAAANSVLTPLESISGRPRRGTVRDPALDERLDVGAEHTVHRLVASAGGGYPACFATSAEVADVAVAETIPEEVRVRQRAEQLRRAPRPAEAISVICENCGAGSEVVVVLPRQPQALDVASALDFAEADAERERVRFQSVHAQNAWLDAVRARSAAFAQFQREHQLCPADAELTPLPEPPERGRGENR
jgi:hypothetical protein